MPAPNGKSAVRHWPDRPQPQRVRIPIAMRRHRRHRRTRIDHRIGHPTHADVRRPVALTFREVGHGPPTPHAVPAPRSPPTPRVRRCHPASDGQRCPAAVCSIVGAQPLVKSVSARCTSNAPTSRTTNTTSPQPSAGRGADPHRDHCRRQRARQRTMQPGRRHPSALRHRRLRPAAPARAQIPRSSAATTGPPPARPARPRNNRAVASQRLRPPPNATVPWAHCSRIPRPAVGTPAAAWRAAPSRCGKQAANHARPVTGHYRPRRIYCRRACSRALRSWVRSPLPVRLPVRPIQVVCLVSGRTR